MQNTQEFIKQHEDELHDLVDAVPMAKPYYALEDAVCKFAQEVDADVDAEDIAYHLALNVLHNYCDDGGEGGVMMVCFFEEWSYGGFNKMEVFVANGGDLRAVAGTNDFIQYTCRQMECVLGLDAGVLEAYDREQKAK